MRNVVSALILAFGLAVLPWSLRAQDVERPVAFDSAGRVMTISPALALRLKLAAPVWPVTGDYTEARLFDRFGSGFVVVVQRVNNVNERYLLTAEQRNALTQAVSTALATAGNLSTGERQDMISEPARGQFVRDQTIAGALLYGPALASLTNSGSATAAVYLATVGATFFTSANVAKNRSISKAQNHMASDGSWRGAAVANGMLYLVAGEDASGEAAAMATLAGGVAGTIFGFHAGRPLTDGEAHGATYGSTMTALTTAGLLSALGAFQGDEPRAAVAGVIGATLAGYPLGLRYVRRAPYTVSPGDVTAMSAVTALGVLGAAALLPERTDSDRIVATTLTAGLLAGALAGDRVLVRRYDFTQSQGRQMWLGAVAGALMGIALPLAAESENGRIYLAGAAVGGSIGMAVTKGMIDPARSGNRLSSSIRSPHGWREANTRAAAAPAPQRVVRLHPENLGIFFARGGERRRVAPLVSVSF